MRRGRAVVDEDDEMPANSSSSSSSARPRVTTSGADQKLVKENLENSLTLIESLAKRLKSNKEGISKENIESWQEKIKEVSTEAIRALHQDTLYETTANQVVNEKFLNQNQSNSSSSATNDENLDLASIKKDINTRVQNQLRNFNPENSNQYKEIVKNIVAAANDEDEDLIIEEVEMTESMTKCPYTMKVMDEPYKNENPKGKCIHHISKGGLDEILKTKTSANCPTAGCRGSWTKATSVIDEAFKRKIERFQRLKHIRTQQSQSSRPGVDLDEIL